MPVDDSLNFEIMTERKVALAIKWGFLAFTFATFTLYGLIQL